ncbi:MAG: NADH-quinone oxidoreductase subunit L [Nitrososphaerales archaeon]|jgi:NADH-quinone oxidoreductase subunit L
MLEAWLVWLVPLIGAPLVPLVSFVDSRASKWFAIGVSGLTAAIGLYQALVFSQPYTESLGGWSIFQAYAKVLGQVSQVKVLAEVNVDGLSVLLAAFVSILSFVIVVYAAGNMKHEKGQARFYSLVLVFIGAMLGLVMAGSLLQLYLFWEIVGICSALLIAFWTDRESARKAGVKAFVVTRFGDIALLLAVIMLFTTLGTTNIGAINSSVGAAGVNWVLIGVLILIGAMGKSAQVPFHVWLPDAMEGPTPVSALIHAATMVNAGVYLVVRMYPIYASSAVLSTSVLVVGLTSLLVGGACACAADDFKRILAYSTISQLGLMFAAIGLGSVVGWKIATSGAIYQLISQGLFKALAFMAAGSVIEALGTRKVDEMGGLARRMKYTYIAFLFAALAMVGLPPLIGFWTKDAILSAAATYGAAAFLVIILGSILTSFYSFRALVKVFHGPSREREVRESGWLMVVPMMALVVLVVVGWIGLNGQSLFAPSLSEAPSILTATSTVAVVLLGFAICYFAFQARSEATARLMQSSAFLGETKAFLLEGIGFDRLYSYVIGSILRPLTRLATGLQSGDLGKNVALLFSILVVLLMLAVTGVI